MATKHRFQYKGYALDCDPMPMKDGRFGAQVAIWRFPIGTGEKGQFLTTLGYFDTEADAVEHARTIGARWVDDNG